MTVALLKTPAELALAQQFDAVVDRLEGSADTRTKRRAAFAAFATCGLPHRRIEEWKYTDLRALVRDPAKPAGGAAVEVTAAELTAALGPWASLDAGKIVFVDGQHRGDLSSLSGLSGVEVAPLAEHFGQLTSQTADAVTALNTAFVTDGALIGVPSSVALAKPLLVVSLTTGTDARRTTLRHVIKVGADARATIVELYLSIPGAAANGEVNTLTEVTVGDGAGLTHVKATRHSATHLSNWIVSLASKAQYRGFQATSDTALARNGIAVAFGGSDAKLDLSGIFLGRGRDHIDTTLTVDHAVPHCESRELFAGVLDGHARGIFQGKIIVQRQAQKTDGKQMARVLMLSPDAEFDSKPELEIYADDVVCGHGSTVAELDGDLMFYCGARGIPPNEARAMLVESFIGEAIERVQQDGVREALMAGARGWLAASANATDR